jgi:S-adenosylmethionine decarboxylase
VAETIATVGDASTAAGVGLGREDFIDARGCDPAALASRDVLARLFDEVVADLHLHVLDERWHTFPGAGGVTGLLLLSESHLTVHTFPERGVATFNLYCCRPKPDWPWAARLRERLGATHVQVRSQRRG